MFLLLLQAVSLAVVAMMQGLPRRWEWTAVLFPTRPAWLDPQCVPAIFWSGTKKKKSLGLFSHLVSGKKEIFGRILRFTGKRRATIHLISYKQIYPQMLRLTPGSVGVPQLRGPRFDPELMLHVCVGFLFPPTYENHAKCLARLCYIALWHEYMCMMSYSGYDV